VSSFVRDIQRRFVALQRVGHLRMFLFAFFLFLTGLLVYQVMQVQESRNRAQEPVTPPVVVDPGFGKAFHSGGTGLIKVPGQRGAHKVLSSFTIEAWVHPNSTVQAGGIFGKPSNVSAPPAPFVLQLSNNSLQFTSDANGVRNSLSAQNVIPTANKWYHIAITVDATSGETRIFRDGVLVAQRNPGQAQNFNDPDFGITIGGLEYVKSTGEVLGHGFQFDGSIDEVRLSNTIRYVSDFAPQRYPFSADAFTMGLWHMDGAATDEISGISGELIGTSSFIQSSVPYSKPDIVTPTITPLITVVPTSTPTMIPLPTRTPTPTRRPTSTPRPASVTITRPVNNSYVDAGRRLYVVATTANQRDVNRVEVYVGNTRLCVSTSSSATCSWNVPSQKGVRYSLRAVSYTRAGVVTQSSVVLVTSR
jgi:hypothetical protein